MDESKTLNNHIKTDINNITESERAEMALELARNELEQRLAERTEALKKSETLLFEMATQVPGVVYQFYARPNGEMGFYYISDRSERVLGLKPDLEGYFERFTALVIPEHRKGFIKSIEKAVKESGEWKYEGILQKPSGEKIWFFGNSTPSPRENEIVFNGIVSDITERKQAEEILKRELDNLSSIFEVMNDGVYIVNQQYDIQYVNWVLQEEHGSWKGVKCYKYFHDRTEICPWCPNQKVFAGETVRWEWYSEKNGKTYDLIDTPLKGPDGSILKLEIFRDITERKQAEEKLKIKDVAIASSINAIAICDLQGNMEYANNSLITMWGYKNAKEVLGKNATEFWQFGKDAEDVIKEEKEKGGWTGELKAKKKDGSFFDVQISASLIKDENGNPVKLMGAFLDITERKHTQDEIVKAKDYTDNIIKSMFDTLIVINPDGKIRSINEATAVLLDYKEEELIGKPFGTIVAKEEEEEEEEGIPFIGTRLKKLIKEGFIKEYDTAYKTKSGEMIPVSFSGAVMRDKDGKLIGIVCIGRDLRERKQAAEALRESEVRHKELLIRAAEGIAAADLETMQFRYVNPSMCRIFGYTEEELTRLGVEDIHPKESLDHVLAEFEAQARGEKTLASDLPCLRKDGTLFYANVSAAPAVLGGHKCLVGFFTDTTERKQVESQREAAFGALRESERKLKQLFDKTTRSQEELKASYAELKMSKDDLVRSEKLAYTGRIAASIAHEIRNPLTNVSMSVRQLKKGGRIKPEGLKHREIIERNVGRINFLITELLNCARPAKFNPQLCDMHQVIEDALIADKGKIRSQKVKVVKFLSAKPSILKIDKEHMGRVLLNLISNAVDAMSGGGNLTINTEINNDLFLIKVQDSGKGIPEKDIIRIFDPFFSTKPQGVGLGLTTCYGIIVSHGGTIEVESKWRKGTTFVISLPIESAQRERERERESEIAGTSLDKRLKVLGL